MAFLLKELIYLRQAVRRRVDVAALPPLMRRVAAPYNERFGVVNYQIPHFEKVKQATL
jgi:hypothetical protein